MREQTYHIYLDSRQKTTLLHSLVELKNQLIQQGRYCKEYYSSKEIEYFDDYTLQEVLEKSKIREEWDNKFDAVKNAKEQFLTLKIAKEISTE